MDGYDGLVADAYKVREMGYDGQVARLKAMGRVGTLNTQWHLPPNFQDALWLIEDYEGVQTLRNRVLKDTYGMTLEEYEAEMKEKKQGIRSIDIELHQREVDALQQKLDKLQGVKGDD